MADDVEVPGQVADWVKGAGQEELRQEDEREEQVCRALVWQQADDQCAKRGAEDGNQDERREDREHLRQGERDAEHNAEGHNGEGLWEGNERFAENLAGENGSATDWGNEDLLAEVVLAVLKDGDEPEGRRLPDTLRQLPRKDEGEQVDTRRLEV